MKISRKVFDLFLSYILDANEIETVSSYYFEFGVSSFLQTLQKFKSRHSKHALCQKSEKVGVFVREEGESIYHVVDKESADFVGV